MLTGFRGHLGFRDGVAGKRMKSRLAIALVGFGVVMGHGLAAGWAADAGMGGLSPKDLAVAPRMDVRIGKTFDSWAVICETPSGTIKEKCFVQQKYILKDANKPALTASIGNLGPKGERLLIALLPLGINLHMGGVIKVDEGDQIPIALQNCTLDGCLGTAQIPDKDFHAMFNAKSIMVGVMPWGGDRTVTIPISPRGLKAALDSIKAR